MNLSIHWISSSCLLSSMWSLIRRLILYFVIVYSCFKARCIISYKIYYTSLPLRFIYFSFAQAVATCDINAFFFLSRVGSTSLRNLAVSLYFYVTLIKLCISISPDEWSPFILQFTQMGRLHYIQKSYNLTVECKRQLLITFGFYASSVLLCLCCNLLRWWL